MNTRLVSWLLHLYFLLFAKAISGDYKTVRSERSGQGDDDETVAKCQTGYYLIRCTTVSGSVRDGNKVDASIHGCVAVNGNGGNGVIVSRRNVVFSERLVYSSNISQMNHIVRSKTTLYIKHLSNITRSCYINWLNNSVNRSV